MKVKDGEGKKHRKKQSTETGARDWYLVAYDIRNEVRLRRVARVMEGYGARLQYSVFRCRLSERSIEQLRWKLSQVLKPEDGLLIAGLCRACIQRLRTRDSRGEWPEDPPGWVVV
jgi:CRISPR-associated protein Cas2